MLHIAIIGRPNVGKSTLFNRLCGLRKAIVGNEPGITRDRIYGNVVWRGRSFGLIDTGGLLTATEETIPSKIFEQVEKAIEEVNLILLVVDGRAGITPADEQILPMLRRSGRRAWVVVNKIDSPDQDLHVAPFYAFGLEKVISVSAEHNRGLGDLLDEVAAAFPQSLEREDQPEEADEIVVAVVGRPNVGKSSIVNRMLGMERCIVSEVPGTTRDAVDTLLIRERTRYRIVDTAGIRRKGKTEARTEKVSVLMARKNLSRAQIALLIIDAVEGVTKLDAAIGGYAASSGCSVIIVLNKWDKIVKGTHTIEKHAASVYRRMKYLSYSPIVSVSALTGQRVPKLFDLIRAAHEGRRMRIPTSTLNNLFVPELTRKWKTSHPAGRLGIRYITQARTDPPTFVVFTPGSRRLHFSSERFLINQLRENFGFYATPIRIRQRVKSPRTTPS